MIKKEAKIKHFHVLLGKQKADAMGRVEKRSRASGTVWAHPTRWG